MTVPGKCLVFFVLVQTCFANPPTFYHPRHHPYPWKYVPEPHPVYKPEPVYEPEPDCEPEPIKVVYSPIHFKTHSEILPEYFSMGLQLDAVNNEGAWNKDGKQISIADTFYQNVPNIDSSNANIASNFYNLVESDIELMVNMSARHVRLGIAWTRIFEDGVQRVNKEGIKHYKRLFELLVKNNIEPIVTLYHADLPQCLQDQGGFLNDNFRVWYAEYAKVVFECFGKYVKYWITFTNPTSQCAKGYGSNTYPPGLNENPGYNEYICGRNLLLAHADVWHMYDKYFRPTQKGKVSIELITPYYEADCHNSAELIERRLQFQVGWWAHPIYNGNYPKEMIQRIAELSKRQGLHVSRLCELSKKEIEWIKGTHDFFAMDYFYVSYLKPIPDEYCLSPSYNNDAGSEVTEASHADWGVGMKNILIWIKENYKNPAIFIVGNAFMTKNPAIDDPERRQYMENILENIYEAVNLHSVRVYGYTHYMLDGFVQMYGYTYKLGLYFVDMDCPDRPRTPRLSTEYFQYVAKYRSIRFP